MKREGWDEVVAAAAAGDINTALSRCRRFWDGTGGPAPQGDDGVIRELTSRLNVWEQITLFVWEVNRRPHNARTWKLLAYAYMWAGLYIPALLRAAEQAFLVSMAHEEDDALKENINGKIELIRYALAGDAEARAELAMGERAFAAAFDGFPEQVPMPEAFVTMGIVARPALPVTTAALAQDLRELLER